jgi:NADH dehydrogenase
MNAMLTESRHDEATPVLEAPHRQRKRVVIVVGGFAGIAAAHALRHADVEIVPDRPPRSSRLIPEPPLDDP